ncbi:MAG: alpha/beta hydrolase [Alicyclobacillaceae bacterium]|nr:alpha/beta hydrolase [Alicyclobacillaceae bacterium]
MGELDPRAKAYIEAFYQMQPIYQMTPEQARQRLAQAPVPEVPVEAVASIREEVITTDDDAHIRVRIYTPHGQGPFPLFVYYHGGGWVLGNLDTCDPTCRSIAHRTQSVVVSVDYRLAPEHKFPTPLQDAYTALLWTHRHAGDLNGDAGRLVVGGDSAGGNLAISVCMLAREQGPNIEAQVLIYPVTDVSRFDTASYNAYATGFGLERQAMMWFASHYLRTSEDAKNPYVSPLLADNVAGLPAAFVVTAEFDVLRDDGFAYAERLKAAGVDVEYVCEPGMVHAYFTNMAVFDERIRQTIDRIKRFLEQRRRAG